MWHYIVLWLNSFIPIKHVNLGGGLFLAVGWKNLEKVDSVVNPNPFSFSPNCIFPFSDNSIETVYSSHALEHMDQPTVDRALWESYRVLKPGGHLILKLPDFDQVLECWKKGDAEFFNDDLAEFSQLCQTWKNRRVSDTLDSRAAFIFCGFWNDAWGDHFKKIWSGETPGVITIPEKNKDKLFFGPPAVSEDTYRKLKKTCSPKEISKELCQIVMDTETDYHFNHQNAWARHELKDLVTGFGFIVLSQNSEVILNSFKSIPTIRDISPISMYLLAKKPNVN